MHKYKAIVRDTKGDLVVVLNVSSLDHLAYYVNRGWEVTTSLNSDNDR